MSEVVEDGGQFLGDGVLVLADGGRVGVPPVNRQPVEPHVGLLHVRLPQARLEAVHLAAGCRQVALQVAVTHAQPAVQQSTRNKEAERQRAAFTQVPQEDDSL